MLLLFEYINILNSIVGRYFNKLLFNSGFLIIFILRLTKFLS